MPSPFPGMDPYLEHPDIFPDFHDAVVTYLSEWLQSRLPAPYSAWIGRRVWVPVPHDEHVEPLVEICIGRGADRRLVTAIEVLSLSNKTPGEHGRDLYLRKQREILESKVHLVEIDLLRGGEHTTAVPRRRLVQAVGTFDYHVSIHHFDNLEDYFVYPFTVCQPLPVIAIPLLPDDPAVSLDLQAVFRRTYDAGPYQREIDYRQDPVLPPLTPEQETWARELLR